MKLTKRDKEALIEKVNQLDFETSFNKNNMLYQAAEVGWDRAIMKVQTLLSDVEEEEKCCTAKCGVHDCCPCHTPLTPKEEEVPEWSRGTTPTPKVPSKLYITATAMDKLVKINEIIEYLEAKAKQ